MIYLKLLSLICVSVAFLGLVAWVYLPRNKARLQQYGSIPLSDDEPGVSGEKIMERTQ